MDKDVSGGMRCWSRIFTPSVRHAATSSALAKGVEINVIKSLAGWSKTSKVFETFYNKPIIKDKRELAKTILS